ncbi:hypothetical protein ACFL6I_16515 [candidate division KSB1 bacterium]
MNGESGNQNFKLFAAFLIGVLVGSFSLWMWTATQSELFKKVSQEEVTNNEIASEEQTAIVQDFNATETQLHNDAVVVRNQASGLSVVVERAVLEEDGWVVIHEGTVSHIGNALGAARFDKGENSGVVELLRATEPGVTYRAVLYRDNGDKEFNLDTDFPFLQDGNQPVLTTFIVE